VQLADGVLEHQGAGGVDRAHPGHPQDHHPDVGDLGQLRQEAVPGGEEQRPVDPVRQDVPGEQRVLLLAVPARQVGGGRR
jgi:hypothetical protein